MTSLSVFRGLTIPIGDLYDKIEEAGWQPGKCAFKNGTFTATATLNGEKIEKTGLDERTAVANVLRAVTRKNQIRSAALHLGMWSTTFTDKLPQIAEAYAKAPVYDPKAAPAWKELADDSTRRAQALGQQIQIEVVDDPEPYANNQEMCQDVHNNKRFKVSRANSQHPIWSVDQNVAFRIVHDIMGHCVSGGDFGWQGENLACAAHFPLLSPTAQKALFTECIGQTGYALYYHGFGPQKVAFLDEFLEPAQGQENGPGYQGVHPTQSVAPTAMPQATPSEPVVGEPGFGERAARLNKEADNAYADPNAGFQTGFDPLPQNGYLFHGDPMQANETLDNAQKIDTGWSQFTKEDGTPDYDRMKQAIVNAFRVVLLSPRKDLRWNAVHYQNIAGVPASVSDPKVYWDTLEAHRRAWNTAQGFDAEAHMPYYKFLKPFEAVIYAKNHSLGPQGAHKKAEEVLFEWWTQEQQRIEQEDARKPADRQRNADEIERRANEALARRLNDYIRPKPNDRTDVPHKVEQMAFAKVGYWPHDDDYFQADSDFAEEWDGDLFRIGDNWYDSVDGDLTPHTAAGEQYNLMTGEAGGKYGAFMGSHLKAIAQISQHSDQLLNAALEDVRQHDGTGRHFRQVVLSLGVSGAGPKVASFAWLLLQPMTSQLATIDTHMMDVLGHNYEKEMNNRDYFKFERELQAGRDASGYGHVPLGAFQWGMWDLKRSGPGVHQDHSAMRVLDPVPHDQIDWAAKAQSNLKGEDWAQVAPQWWADTQPARQQVADQWDQNVAPNFAQNRYPFQVYDPGITTLSKERNMSSASASTVVPWIDTGNGNISTGLAGESYPHLITRALGIPAHEYWQQQTPYSLGKYDHATDSMVVAAGSPDENAVHEYLRGIFAPSAPVIGA